MAGRGRMFACSRRTVYGIVLFLQFVALAILAPYIAPIEQATEVHLSYTNLPLASPGHFLGTDHLGRDIFAQVVWGARASLTVGVLASILAVAFGSLWGASGAFAGGVVDAVMMRLVDGLLAVPAIVLLLALQSLVSPAVLSASLPPPVLDLLRVTTYSWGLLPLLVVVVVITATNWLEAARITHASVLSLKSSEYIAAARALGAGFYRIIWRHLLPNAMPVIAVEAALLVSDSILMEAGLSFLGLGLGPSIPSWGGMLSSAQAGLIEGNWWAALVPGLCITTVVLSINLLGEGWRELLSASENRSARLSGLIGSGRSRATARPAP